MHLGADAVPAEDEYGEKSGFKEEGENAFCSQGGAENVAYETGVGGPVGTEFEFHDNASGDAHGKK